MTARWVVPAAAGAGHLLLVGAGLLALGDRVPGPVATVGLLALGALPVHWLRHTRLRLPVLLLVLGILAAGVLELLTPGPWVSTLGGDRLTVGTPVLRSYAEASPLWLVAAGLAGLGEASLGRSRSGRSDRPRVDRPGWARAGGTAVLVTAGVIAAPLLTGVSRGWWDAPPPGLLYGPPVLAVLGLGAVLLLRRTRLVTPWLVLLAATGSAAVLCWVQAPAAADGAAGLLEGSRVSLGVALVFGLVEAAGRGLARLTQAGRNRASGLQHAPETASSSQ